MCWHYINRAATVSNLQVFLLLLEYWSSQFFIWLEESEHMSWQFLWTADCLDLISSSYLWSSRYVQYFNENFTAMIQLYNIPGFIYFFLILHNQLEFNCIIGHACPCQDLNSDLWVQQPWCYHWAKLPYPKILLFKCIKLNNLSKVAVENNLNIVNFKNRITKPICHKSFQFWPGT